MGEWYLSPRRHRPSRGGGNARSPGRGPGKAETKTPHMRGFGLRSPGVSRYGPVKPHE